ncbi:unnamed protein product [Clonostachys byssicola]|uniref:FAD-binding PCMH-type domain-containing protein n=1 Tax=Clonostachys byssicola TaxID=160290 RepID=A0A9N9Y4C1_9HYPO|nr:unnamed protein product [Clonostachys byssicola]
MLFNIFTVLGGSVAFAIATANQTRLPLCCDALESIAELRGKVYLSGSDAYADRIDTYFSKSAALEPWCMVLPSTTEDVSLIIKALVANECPFGVRSGGHSSHPLSNSVEKGITVDFGHMNATTWNSEKGLVSIQPGSRWQDVYDVLTPHGITVAGGRVGSVGVGGLLSGGGISFFAASHGWACDNIANYEVVLADGSIVYANAQDNPDLWQALKGASANLGLVTRFDMLPIELLGPSEGTIWGGNLIFGPASGNDLIGALVQFTDNVHKDENSSVSVSFSYQPKLAGGMVGLVSIENTLALSKPPAFDGFYGIGAPLNDTTRVDTMSALSRELSEGQPTGFRNMFITASFKNDPRPMKYALDKINKFNAELEEITQTLNANFTTVYTVQPVTKSIVEKSIAKGGNVMGLDRYLGDGNGILFLLIVSTDDAEVERLAMPKAQALVRDVEAYAEKLGLGREWKYLNYAHGSQDAIATVGEEALGKLQAASAKYDPSRAFQRLRTSGFKIPQDE